MGKVIWYSHLFKNFPQLVVIQTVKGFCLVSEAELDVFLEFPCFLSDPMNVDNSISSFSLLFLFFSYSVVSLWDPLYCSTPGFPVLHHLPELAQTPVHPVGDAVQPSRPLLSPSPAFNLCQHQGLFWWVSSLHTWDSRPNRRAEPLSARFPGQLYCTWSHLLLQILKNSKPVILPLPACSPSGYSKLSLLFPGLYQTPHPNPSRLPLRAGFLSSALILHGYLTLQLNLSLPVLLWFLCFGLGYH